MIGLGLGLGLGLANPNPSILFHQLAISAWAPSLSLESAASYRYLASCTHVPSIDDAADFEAMSTAFSAMGFSQEDVQARAPVARLSGSVSCAPEWVSQLSA